MSFSRSKVSEPTSAWCWSIEESSERFSASDSSERCSSANVARTPSSRARSSSNRCRAWSGFIGRSLPGPAPALPEERADLLGRYGGPVPVTLGEGAAQGAQSGDLFGGLHALGEHGEVEGVSQAHDGGHDGRVVGV